MEEHTLGEECLKSSLMNVCLTVKHGGGSVMVWGCFCGNELGMLVRVSSSMNKEEYWEVLSNGMLPSAWSIRGLDCVPTRQCSMSSSYIGHTVVK